MSETATYVALLRAINVGGKTKVEMPRLVATFSALGCAGVRTYINSGNVVFRESRVPGELRGVFAAGIEQEFGFAVPVLLRDLPEMRALCDAIPARWTNDGEQKTDVLFLQDGVDSTGAMASIVHDPAIENVLPLPGALVWNIAREHARRRNSVRIVGSDLYRRLTIRNVNTVRKLRDLMEQAG